MKNFKNAHINLFLSFFISILLAINVFQSCKKEPSQFSAEPLPLLERLIASYNVGKPVGTEYQASLIQGTMTAMTLPSNEALFFLKKAGSDTTLLFWGQGEVLSAKLLKELGQVRVAYLHESVVIETAEKDYYVFSIGEGRGHELTQQVKAQWNGQGYGLAVNWNTALLPEKLKSLNSLNELRESSCKCRKPAPPPAGQIDNCDAGGVGSTSCSVSGTATKPGCSVT